MTEWYQAVVGRGDQTGRQAGYPTINLAATILPATTSKGVYASQVKLGDQLYAGALYFGPRLVKDEEHDVLEIYLLDFTGELYDQQLEFKLNKFIRPPQDFSDLAALKAQISLDVTAVKEALNEK